MSRILSKIGFGNPILRLKAQKLSDDEITSDEIQQFILDMYYTLEHKKYGVGVAASQLGRSIAISVIDTKPTPTRPELTRHKLTIINPEITKVYGYKVSSWEGCISGTELYAQVPRYKKVRLKWQDEKNTVHEEDFDGFLAHVIQHEVDHLNGILFVDKVKDTKSYMTFKEYRKMRKAVSKKSSKSKSHKPISIDPIDDELVDILDDKEQIIRQELKTLAHQEGLRHKTVIGYLRYGNEWALVRQATHKQDAGQLVAPVGGHVKAHETEIDALLRESEEEIGTRNIKYKHMGSKVFHRQVIGRDENHLFAVYEISTTDPIKLNQESVAIERFSPAALKKALLENPDNFGDAYYFVLEIFYPQYLPKAYIKRWS